MLLCAEKPHMIKWFVLDNDDTNGPFSTEQVKSLSSNGLIGPEAMVWSRIQSDWLDIQSWLKNIDNVIEFSDHNENAKTWYIGLDNVKHGPFNRKELIEELKKKQPELKKILLWTKGMKNWNPLFEFLDVIDELGINARQFPRAAIDGCFTCEINNSTVELPLATVSENGIGLLNSSGLYVGQKIDGDIYSKALHDKLRVTVEVRYTGDYGFVGLKFVQINMESKQILIDYVKSHSDQVTKKAA